MDKYLIGVLYALGITEFFLRKNYIIGTILLLYGLSDYLSKKAQKYRRRKTKNNSWLKCYILNNTLIFLISILYIIYLALFKA